MSAGGGRRAAGLLRASVPACRPVVRPPRRGGGGGSGRGVPFPLPTFPSVRVFLSATN